MMRHGESYKESRSATPPFHLGKSTELALEMLDLSMGRAWRGMQNIEGHGVSWVRVYAPYWGEKTRRLKRRKRS